MYNQDCKSRHLWPPTQVSKTWVDITQVFVHSSHPLEWTSVSSRATTPFKEGAAMSCTEIKTQMGVRNQDIQARHWIFLWLKKKNVALQGWQRQTKMGEESGAFGGISWSFMYTRDGTVLGSRHGLSGCSAGKARNSKSLIQNLSSLVGHDIPPTDWFEYASSGIET